MLNARATLWRIFGILFIFSITFTAFAQEEQQSDASLSKSQFMQIIDRIDKSKEETRKHVDEKFDKLDKKFDELDEKFDELDKQVAVLNTKVNILIAVIVTIFTLIVAPILVFMLVDRFKQRNNAKRASAVAPKNKKESDEGVIRKNLMDNQPSESEFA